MKGGKKMKRQFLRRLVAAIGGLTMAAMLPVSSMASAAEDPTIRFVANKSTVQAGDMVMLSVNVDHVPAAGWNVMEFSISYDNQQLEPVMFQEHGKDYEWMPGPAMDLMDQMTIVNLSVNPILAASISANGQCENGEYLYIQFKVNDHVNKGDKLTLTVDLKQFAQSIIVDGTPHTVDLVQPGTSTITLTVL